MTVGLAICIIVQNCLCSVVKKLELIWISSEIFHLQGLCSNHVVVRGLSGIEEEVISLSCVDDDVVHLNWLNKVAISSNNCQLVSHNFNFVGIETLSSNQPKVISTVHLNREHTEQTVCD